MQIMIVLLGHVRRQALNSASKFKEYVAQWFSVPLRNHRDFDQGAFWRRFGSIKNDDAAAYMTSKSHRDTVYCCNFRGVKVGVPYNCITSAIIPRQPSPGACRP
jgi:hypothetical protein